MISEHYYGNDPSFWHTDWLTLLVGLASLCRMYLFHINQIDNGYLEEDVDVPASRRGHLMGVRPAFFRAAVL